MIRARIVDVLLRYDAPLLSAAVAKDGRTYMCLNIDERDDGSDRFLATYVRPRDVRRFIDEEVDLRFLIRSRHAKHYSSCTCGEIGELVELEPFRAPIDAYLPDPSLFLRDYAGPLRAEGIGLGHVATRKVLIDGHWALGDMRKFSNVLEDAYSFLFALHDDAATDQGRIRALFEKYPWRGGFSAVNFFEQLNLIVPFRYRPTVAEMSKMSPGYMDISLHPATAKQVERLVTQIGQKDSKQQLVYAEVHRALRDRKWLGRSANEVRLKAADIEFLKQQIGLMASALHLASRVDFINELARNDPLAAVKILLSVYRRVKELADYLDTGKAQFAVAEERAP